MNKEKLIKANIDYDSGVHRFADKNEIYEKYLLKFFNDNEMNALKQALIDKEFEGAFFLAHDIKGSAGNLSLTVFFNKINKLVTALREGIQDESLMEMYIEAEGSYNTALGAVKEEQNG